MRLSGTNAIPARIASAGVADAAFLAVDADRASIDRVGAGDRPRELGPPAADESGEADDLSRADRERDVVEYTLTAQLVDLEHDGRGGVPRLLEVLGLDSGAEHAGDEAGFRFVGRGGRSHQPPVTKDGHGVGQLEGLVEEVADVHDRRPGPRQCTDHLVQRLRLDVRQRRGRLVHDDHSRVTGDGAQDLDLLLVGGAELADQCVALELEAPARDELRVLLLHLPPHDEPATPGLDAEEDVLHHGEMRNERQLLGDQCDPVLAGVARRRVLDRPSIDLDLAVVRADRGRR